MLKKYIKVVKCILFIANCWFFLSVVIFFFWSFGINDFNTFNIENWVPLKPVLGSVKDDALFIISHEQTQSIKPSLQFSYLYYGLVKIECWQIRGLFREFAEFYYISCIFIHIFLLYFRLHIYDYTAGNIPKKISPTQGLYGVYDKYYSKVSGGVSDYVTSGNTMKLDYQGKPTLTYDGFKILITSFRGKTILDA